MNNDFRTEKGYEYKIAYLLKTLYVKPNNPCLNPENIQRVVGADIYYENSKGWK